MRSQMMPRFLFAFALTPLFFLSPVRGQANSDNQPVTRQEVDDLKKDNAQMKKELADVKKAQTDQATSADQDSQDNDKALKGLSDMVDKIRPGLENVVIAGDASFGFQTLRKTPSTFFADLSPLILWQPPESHILIESAFDLGIGGADINSESTAVTLNLADISYSVCDYFIVGGGLFAVPFGQFHNHFDPPWVDKFPDDPMAFDAISPGSEVGFFAKGVIPSGTTRWTYDLYIANGPNLDTVNAGSAGQLNFDDFTDLNNNKAVGARIGFLPLNDMDMGYSFQYSKPNPDGLPNIYAFLQAVDFHYKPLVKQLSGRFDLAAEWIWSEVSDATYDPTGGLGFGPITFNNHRQGGYVSLCYRPTEVDNKYLRNTEFCLRYDSLESATSSPGGEHESRMTLGVDYWLTSYCVVKTAYEFDKKMVGPDQNAFILQIGYGL